MIRVLFTIDVEEDMPGWEIADPIRVDNVRALPRLAEVCRELGVEPTYLCDYPVATVPESRAILAELAQAGGCELGTHMHPWNTPPYDGIPGSDVDERTVPCYGHELGVERFRNKMESVHEAVTALTGVPPISFRAGRFGLDGPTLAVLPELGYRVDTSVTPMVHHLEDGGPDFRRAPHRAYRPSRHDICAEGDLPIAEIPVSIGLTRGWPLGLQRAYARVPRWTKVRGLLSRDFLGLVDFGWLYPARFELDVMKRVADGLVARGMTYLNVFLHSSELMPGAAYYGQTQDEIDACLERIRGILAHCLERHGAQPSTLGATAPELFARFGIDGPAEAVPA